MCHIYIIDGRSIRHTGNTNNVRIQYPNISTHLDVCMATIQPQNERFFTHRHAPWYKCISSIYLGKALPICMHVQYSYMHHIYRVGKVKAYKFLIKNEV